MGKKKKDFYGAFDCKKNISHNNVFSIHNKKHVFFKLNRFLNDKSTIPSNIGTKTIFEYKNYIICYRYNCFTFDLFEA